MLDAVSRIFIGFKLPSAVTTSVSDIQMTLKRKVIADLRWTDPSELVLNLFPLGEQLLDRAAMIPGLVQPALAPFQPMDLCLEGLSGLPNAVQPRYVCLNLTGDTTQLMAMQAAIAKALGPLTGPQEGRGFQPYVVLGRLRKEGEPERVALGRGMRVVREAKAGNFRLDHVSLMRMSGGDGVSCTTVHQMQLAGI
jgi:2'-5' RNA ligase